METYREAMERVSKHRKKIANSIRDRRQLGLRNWSYAFSTSIEFSTLNELAGGSCRSWRRGQWLSNCVLGWER